ncbi:zinc finger CCCH domain-containing protein ZFN-like isoform X1 [Cynara cardunculus var. scolymus]|uniref:zinc finger CCCH domain-containing protein ZFN-like isoform X1 n=1 Tax=Cynara cardunculus var. scolymus TaxID=59895 RepID=UPI000D6255C7|nr:zinc finger CCCH domain-containing protein ZFN-like isoform X1 [Cynara cardunculus var. scolymus]
MPDNRRVQRNGGVANSSSNPVHNIEEAVRPLRIQTDGKADGTAMAGSMAYPDRPGEPDCIFYLRTGMCGYGNSCRFNHPTHIGQANYLGGELPERVGEPDCVYFLKTGTCKFGSTCKYNHPRDRRGAGPVVLNMVGLPMRQEEKACPHYIRTGSCKFGVACKFHHPQPSLDGSISYASTLVPSSGSPPHISGISAWSLPRATYVSDPLLQTPQTYLPIVLPHSQGIGPTQGWSTYMGSLSPVSSASIFGGSGSIDQAYPLTSASNLPERPGEPECRYFMNTGNCKYGSDCKYHHPKEKIAQMAASSLGPLGLPLRPGQAVCSYYSLYGICKFGPTCKYDHPLVGYSYNYGISMPIVDPSVFPYGGGRHSSAASSPSKRKGGSRSPSPENAASPSHSGSI